MSSSFDVLCASFCEILGIAAPTLSMDENGITAFTIEQDGVAVSVMQPRDVPDLVVIAANLGAVDKDEDPEACRMFMEVNFLMITTPFNPCLGRNPVSGEFVLHYTQRLDHTCAYELHQAFASVVEFATKWRNGLMMRSAAIKPAMVPANLA